MAEICGCVFLGSAYNYSGCNIIFRWERHGIDVFTRCRPGPGYQRGRYPRADRPRVWGRLFGSWVGSSGDRH